MQFQEDEIESESLLPPPATHLSAASRSKLAARRYLPSEKAKGKQRALETDTEGDEQDIPNHTTGNDEVEKSLGRHVTIVFANESESGSGNLEMWVEEGESVGSVKEQIRHLRPPLAPLSLRLIHSGRLLTDGILLLPWLRSLEERVRRQAAGVGGDVESVLKDVGISEEDAAPSQPASERVWLHCNIGGRVDEKKIQGKEDGDEPTAPRRRGFDVLLDAGLSAADVANMRRQFYESRGEEVPEGMDLGDVSELVGAITVRPADWRADDEHARALEEQWIEGDLTAETATTSTEGMYSSILHGLLTGFLFPLLPWFFFRELPLPNFFDADAEATLSDDTPVSERVASSPNIGAEIIPGVVFGKRMQMGILLGTVLNVGFGALRFLN